MCTDTCRCQSEGQCNELFALLEEMCKEWHESVDALALRQPGVRNWKRKSETGGNMSSLEDLRSTYAVRLRDSAFFMCTVHLWVHVRVCLYSKALVCFMPADPNIRLDDAPGLRSGQSR
jgi:hypothetical protein